MKKSFIKAAVVIVSTLAFVFVVSLYDSEKLAEPIIGYSEAVTQIPLDNMWEETEQQTEEAIVSDVLTAATEITSSESITSSPQNAISEVSEQNELININTASAEELKQLNGIGDVIAERIVEYAKTIGFNSIEEIKNVKGIGDKKFDNIKDKITV